MVSRGSESTERSLCLPILEGTGPSSAAGVSSVTDDGGDVGQGSGEILKGTRSEKKSQRGAGRQRSLLQQFGRLSDDVE